jgi:1-phosphatidylinositol phosphodiesterase
MIARGFGWPKWGLGVIGVNERVGRWLLGIFAGDAPNPDARLIPRFFNLNTANPKKAQTIRKKGAIDEPRIRGWAYMDFYQDPVESGIIPLLVECNFRGRKLGEEGWI